jgi:hypothetical protein
LFREQVPNGDINWIAPRRMYAFSGPHARKEDADNYSHSIPADYLGYFRENNVTDVVRLSQVCGLQRCATAMPGNRCLRA